MYESGCAMRHVHFPTDAIISLQYLMENGASTATLVVGNVIQSAAPWRM